MRFPRAIFQSVVVPAVFSILFAFLPLTWAAELAAKKPDSPYTRTERIVFAPAKLRFGQVAVGRAKIQTVTITNASESDRRLLRVITKGKGFVVGGLDLPLALAKGERFTFSTMFAPGSHGEASGSISFVWDQPSIESAMPMLRMTGVGTDEQLSVDPAAMNFGAVAVGSTSSQAGKLTAPGSQVTISSAVSSSPQFACTGLSFPVTIPPGGSVGFTVMFSPQIVSAASATLSFLDDAGNTLAVEYLTGTGILFQNHRVDLSWDASTSQDVIGYNVYRGTASGGPYQQINSVLDASTVYTDTSVTDGDTYYYVVTAVNSSEQESGYSNEAQAVIPGDESVIAGAGRGLTVIRPTFTRRVATARQPSTHH